MLASCKRIGSQVLNWGAANASSPQLARRLRLSNALALVCFVSMALWTLGDMASSSHFNVALSAIGCLLSLSPLIVARSNRPLLARHLLVVVANLVTFSGAIMYPRSAGGALLLIPLVGVPLMLYEFERRRLIFAAASLPAILFGLSEARAWLLPEFNMLDAPAWSFAANATIAFVGSFLMVLYFHFENRRSEVLLSDLLKATRLSQEKLIHSSKMSALGHMAAAIAHEVKSPLVTICGGAGLLKKIMADEDFDPKKAIDVASRIEATGFRIGRIVSSLQNFAREGTTDPPATVDIGKVIADTLELCEHHCHRSGVYVQTTGINANLKVWGRSVQLSQVLLNLLTNAFDAVAEKDERWVALEVHDDGNWVEIAVIDSGPGIPLEIRGQIMEAFFTTKPLGQGTGLGLSLSKNLVEQNGGSLTLDTTSSRTRFVVRCPKPPHSQATWAERPESSA